MTEHKNIQDPKKYSKKDYERFYDSAPDRYGYREEWEV
jgi:hypothetical protein